jgi:hypothetical protein
VSENPLRDMDTELASITQSFGRASTTVLNAGRLRGRGAPSPRGMRQTKAPSAAQLRTMTPGTLTKYMWKTHLRGMNGHDVSAETARVSAELEHRGLTAMNQQWKGLAEFRADQVNHLAGQQHVQTPVPTQQDVSHQHTEQASPKQQNTSTTGAQNAAGWATPDIASGIAALSAGALAGDLLADAVDAHATDLGLDPSSGADLESTVDQSDDLQSAGAPEEAVEASQFASGAVVGELGQAMTDELGDGGSAAEATQENQAEAAPTAEPATVEA